MNIPLSIYGADLQYKKKSKNLEFLEKNCIKNLKMQGDMEIFIREGCVKFQNLKNK